MKKIVTILLTYILIMVLAGTVNAATGTVNTETARMRSEASAEASIVDLISLNEQVEVLEEEGEWYKVQYNGNTGYVSKELINVDGEVAQGDANTTQTNETPAENTVEEPATTPETTADEQANTTPAEETQTAPQEQQTTIAEQFVGNLQSVVTVKILPSINSTNIADIPAGAQITVVEILNNWCYIETADQQGWVRLSILQAAVNTAQPATTTEEPAPAEETPEEPAQEQTVGYVNVTSVNVRAEANTTSEVIDSLSINTEVTILGEESDWYNVQVNGKTGYIATQYISNEKVPETTSRASDTARKIQEEKQVPQASAEASTPAPAPSAKGAEVVAYAKQFLGYKYVSGGSSPSTGFDCSGFTSYVYKHFGVSLSRSTSGQKNNGTSVSKANLQLGDLVIFNNSSNTAVGHVGIYVGGNQFIHAANAQKGVIITSLSDSYYKARYVDGRRVL